MNSLIQLEQQNLSNVYKNESYKQKRKGAKIDAATDKI